MENPVDKVVLDHITGWGEDSFQAVLWNLEVQKKVFGDAYAEIIRSKKSKNILNIKPLYTGDMRVFEDDKGIITHYEQRVKKGKPKRLETSQVLHLTNDRVANEIHGISIIDAVKWVIDARNEAMEDWKRLSHRSTIRVLYVDEDDKTRLNNLKSDYAEAIDKGEVLIIPGKPGDASFQELNLPPVEAFLAWIRYLEGFFYQAVGIPRVIATSENYTEAASKVGYLTFEPIYTREQTEMEADLWNQLGIKIKFNRPASLSSTMQSSEQKNTGQTGFQPNDITAGVGK